MARKSRKRKTVWGRQQDVGQYARGAKLLKANRNRGLGKSTRR